MGTEIDVNLSFPIGTSELLKVLPHRYPFLLIDRVESIEGGSVEDRKGRKIVALKNVTANEPHFQGHFPAYPIMPGVLILESMAQACAMCCYIPLPEGEHYDFFIASSNNTKFRRQVLPGDQLVMKVECIKDKKRMILFDCKVFVDDKLVAESEIMASVTQRK
ncbi:MAG: 3-hydroxyacyl-ACP dehydratase FabZ [Bdellovibrionales bacterium]